MKRIAILGSTGSIGRSTLSVAESYPERFQIVALAAGANLEAAFEQAQTWRPRIISIASESDADVLHTRLKKCGLNDIEVVYGSAGIVKVATHPEADFVVSAIVGVAGLEATYEAVKAGKTVGIANKECLVAAGELITTEASRQGKPLLDRKSTRLNSSHRCISYAVFCLKKKKITNRHASRGKIATNGSEDRNPTSSLAAARRKETNGDGEVERPDADRQKRRVD